jgi:nucleoside-diphosphate-sugar epimerase
MIYGCGLDQNIAFIQKIIERFGVFPVAGRGKGLRQPVHAEDLALACIAVLDNDKTLNKAYILSGGEVLTYRDMVARIFGALNRKPRIVNIHPVVYKCAVVVVRHILPRYAFVQAAMVDRMNRDMVFDYSEAADDFGYNPRPFRP